MEAEYDEYLGLHANVVHIGGGIGVDLEGGWILTPRWGTSRQRGVRGVLEAVIASVSGGKPTIGDLARYRGKTQQISGTAEQIVDEIECWQDAGMDGLNIMNLVLSGSYTDFIDGVLPELHKRGLAQNKRRKPCERRSLGAVHEVKIHALTTLV